MQQNETPNRQQARPQNPGYPAGGSIAANFTREGQRGVLVAPPSWKYSDPDLYQVLHKGFDTVAIAVKGHVPPDLFEHLEAQKAIAAQEQRDVSISWNGVDLHLKGHGGKGYQFIASGGPFGANWALKKPNAKDPWGVRVTFGSTFLATLGLGAARAHLDSVLDRFGIRTTPEDVSISRVDYCVDILAPDFVLAPEAFVMHHKTNRREHIADPGLSVNGRSGRVTSVTIGSPRARQIIVYDKRLEVIQKQKPHWWTIWNKARATAGQPDLDPKDKRQKIWRVEFRAGKDLLKDTWDIRNWADLFARFGDLCTQTGDVIRYTEPVPTDRNRARWPVHPLWDIARSEIASDLFEMREGADPNPVKTVIREQHISILVKNLLGSTITLAALEGIADDGLAGFITATGKRLARQAESSPEKSAIQLQNARERYQFVSPDCWASPEKGKNKMV